MRYITQRYLTKAGSIAFNKGGKDENRLFLHLETLLLEEYEFYLQNIKKSKEKTQDQEKRVIVIDLLEPNER